MELYYVIVITNREKDAVVAQLFQESQLDLPLSYLAGGTATSAILSRNGLSAEEKVVSNAIAGPDSLRQLVRSLKRKLSIDIPGNGIMMAIPIKSVGGEKTLAELTKHTVPGEAVPKMDYSHELIIVIGNEGHSDEVMDAARDAGATGGTVLHARGTGAFGPKRFFQISLAEQKDLIYIAARTEDKAAIMDAIRIKAGSDTPAGAICLSLPISYMEGLRAPDTDA